MFSNLSSLLPAIKRGKENASIGPHSVINLLLTIPFRSTENKLALSRNHPAQAHTRTHTHESISPEWISHVPA